ncbi:hypothetical protein BUE80_DR010730 [Diplocarpon rosae]|nr:hypothetical protein BUE80_DR010730 [Diplocarpon rosae]
MRSVYFSLALLYALAVGSVAAAEECKTVVKPCSGPNECENRRVASVCDAGWEADALPPCSVAGESDTGYSVTCKCCRQGQ